MSKKWELHQSQVAVALKCMLMFRRRYIDGIKTPPKAALTMGRSVHSAFQHNFRQKITTGIDVPKEAVLDVYSTEFERQAPDTEWGTDDKGKEKDRGARLVELHHTKLAPTIQPEKVEEKFILTTDAGYDLAGTLDLVEKDGTIVDHKTAKLKYAPDAISRAIQPALYDFAYEALNGKKAKGFRYDVLIKSTKTKGPEIQQVSATVTLEDRSWMISTITQVHKAIQAGVETPAPDGAWWCSADWCGYWSMCKGKGRPKPVVKPLTKIDGIFPVKRSTRE